MATKNLGTNPTISNRAKFSKSGPQLQRDLDSRRQPKGVQDTSLPAVAAQQARMGGNTGPAHLRGRLRGVKPHSTANSEA